MNVRNATTLVIGALLTGCSGPAVHGDSSTPLADEAASIARKADSTKAASTVDPFDPASCSGPALTAQQANSYLNPVTGIQDVKVGRFQTYRRWRAVYPGWPAGAWQTTNLSDVSGNCYSGYFYADRSDGLAQVSLQGEVHIDYDNGGPLISLYGDPANFVLNNADPTVSFNIDDWDFTRTSLPIPVYRTSVPVDVWGYLGNIFPTTALTITYAGHGLTFGSANATNNCVRFVYDGNEAMTDSEGNPWTRESQLVVLGTFGS
jgi:hypothetical protein